MHQTNKCQNTENKKLWTENKMKTATAESNKSQLIMHKKSQ